MMSNQDLDSLKKAVALTAVEFVPGGCVTCVINSLLAESFGFVPAIYSCKFVKPSPSASSRASTPEFLSKPFASSH